MTTYEGSKADMANDRREAKAHKMTLKAWEKSPMDAKMDAAAQRKLDARSSIPEHHFAHGRPRSERS